MAEKIKIGGIDPGLASGGFVVLESWPDKVIAAYSLVEKKGGAKKARAEVDQLLTFIDGWSDNEFTAAALRALAWRDSFIAALDDFESNHGAVDVFAIESFVDQRSRAKEEKAQLIRNRWHTPLVMGHLAQVLEDRGATMRNHKVFYQNAGIVIRQWSTELSALKSRSDRSQDVVVPGDVAVTNDHTRKALAHAKALSLRLQHKEMQCQ